MFICENHINQFALVKFAVGASIMIIAHKIMQNMNYQMNRGAWKCKSSASGCFPVHDCNKSNSSLNCWNYLSALDGTSTLDKNYVFVKYYLIKNFSNLPKTDKDIRHLPISTAFTIHKNPYDLTTTASLKKNCEGLPSSVNFACRWKTFIEKKS